MLTAPLPNGSSRRRHGRRRAATGRLHGPRSLPSKASSVRPDFAYRLAKPAPSPGGPGRRVRPPSTAEVRAVDPSPPHALEPGGALLGWLVDRGTRCSRARHQARPPLPCPRHPVGGGVPRRGRREHPSRCSPPERPRAYAACSPRSTGDSRPYRRPTPASRRGGPTSYLSDLLDRTSHFVGGRSRGALRHRQRAPAGQPCGRRCGMDLNSQAVRDRGRRCRARGAPVATMPDDTDPAVDDPRRHRSSSVTG